jgi:hypothetical protein
MKRVLRAAFLDGERTSFSEGPAAFPSLLFWPGEEAAEKLGVSRSSVQGAAAIKKADSCEFDVDRAL